MKLISTGYKTAVAEMVDEVLWLSRPILGIVIAQFFVLFKNPLKVIPNILFYLVMLCFFIAIIASNLFLLPFGVRVRTISIIREETELRDQEAQTLREIEKLLKGNDRE